MGHPCRHHHLQYQLRSADRFHADRVDLDQSDVAGRQEDAAGRRSQIAGRLHEGASGDAKFVNQNASAQVGGLLLQKLTGTELLFVPYRGAGPAMTDLISGQVDLLLVQGAVALPQVRAGTIKALAELSPERSASMPDIPSASESGVPGLNIAGWFGFYAPKDTPPEIIAKLNSAAVQALADPQVKARFAQLGLDVAAREQQTPEGLAGFQNAEMDKWWPIIKAAGIRGE
jgi:tripartite-type tricarboxylate transporter receptor subunit TctC